MIVLKLILASINSLNHINVFQNAVNMFSKLVNHFCQKAQNLVYFRSYDFVQILPACGPNTFQIMYGETLDFLCQHYNGNTKCLIGKLIFAINIEYKLSRATVANANIVSQKSPLHNLICVWPTCW